MNHLQDRSRHLGPEELVQASMESPDAQHNDSLLKPQRSAEKDESQGKIIKNMYHGEADKNQSPSEYYGEEEGAEEI